MKLRPTQFGVRESTASPGQHASRFEQKTDSHAVCIEEEMPDIPRSAPLNNLQTAVLENSLKAASQRAATGEGERYIAEAFAVTPPRTPSQKLKHSFEPLIGSPEAAKLLGNIHVKTLQRYARRGTLPGYQIGGHWYFRTSELDAWLQSRINSNCQPADRVDFTQEKNQ
jgi:excisionase family DNA binding protein